MTGRRTAVVVILLGVLALGGWLYAGQYTRAAALLVLGAELEGWPRHIAALHERPVAETVIDIPTRSGPIRARAYRPSGQPRSALVLVAGVHPDDIDEPRLVHFARTLASLGLVVVTPGMPQLAAFEIAPDATDAIEDVTRWAAEDNRIGDGRGVGLAGISFSGGLAVVAAGRPALRDRVRVVLSLGGHGDLLRTLETIGGGALDEDGPATADVFGLTVVLTAVAHHAVPETQVDAVRAWGRTYLEAAHLPLGAPARRDGFARADRMAAALPAPSAALVRQVRAGDAAGLRPRLLPLVRRLAGDPALSPERATPPSAPVFLLHGTTDEVIPPDEARLLARHLEPHTDVHLLLTPALGHADVLDALEPADAWALVRFLAGLLRAS